MRNLLLLLVLACLPFVASAQTYDAKADTTKNRATEEYCSILPKGKVFSDLLTVEADFGDPKAYSDHEKLKDERGRELKFRSTVEALNYMAGQGWLLVNTFADGLGQHYLFRRLVAR